MYLGNKRSLMPKNKSAAMARAETPVVTSKRVVNKRNRLNKHYFQLRLSDSREVTVVQGVTSWFSTVGRTVSTHLPGFLHSFDMSLFSKIDVSR